MASHLEDEKGWNYYVSKSKEAIAELAESGENAAEVKDAPAVIVPVYAPAKEAPTAEDVERSRAIGNMLVLMEEIGLAGTWVSVMCDEAQQKKVAEAMHVSSEFMPMGILTLGYPEQDAEEDKPESVGVALEVCDVSPESLADEFLDTVAGTLGKECLYSLLAAMSKWRVAKVVRQTCRCHNGANLLKQRIL